MSGSELMLVGGVPAVAANYIEDVFSTYLYTGSASSQSINNGIDLSSKGGLVWIKNRPNSKGHRLFDTARTLGYYLETNSTVAQQDLTTQGVTAFNANGFTVGTGNSEVNASGWGSYASWTFRTQAKFFDVVTYTGNGSVRSIAHNLGSVPGMVIIKCTSLGGTDWMVYHRSTSDGYLYLNTTAAKMTAGAATFFGDGTSVKSPDASYIYLGSGDSQVNQNTATYVAYLFAHDAGGFGTAGTDNVISCGSYTGNATDGLAVTLGYEPQWVMIKRTDDTYGWYMQDVMRQMSLTNTYYLTANTSNAEVDATGALVRPTATGFTLGTGSAYNASGGTYIYIAIRRGPMKTPTSGTSVYFPNTRTGTGATATVTGVGFPPDLVWTDTRSAAEGAYMFDKLRGTLLGLRNFGTDAEISNAQYLQTFGQDGFTYGTNGSVNQNTRTYIDWCMRRAPGFFDVVCYTGTGSNTTQTHNLGVVPELIIVKRRDTTGAWDTYSSALSNTEYLVVNTTAAKATGATRWNSTTPTSTVFSLGTSTTTNASGGTYVAYLFASVSGVSKVGSYTGNGSSQTINCGFTAGSRFVLIKRTDDTGSWYVFDSARGIVAGNDPYLLLNSDAAEVTTYDAVDTDNSGFVVNNDATNYPINVSSATYIFLAIA